MIHVSRPMANIAKEHAGFLVNNQEDVPIFFVEEKDTVNKDISRQTLCSYFGGDFFVSE